ncbi:hypothetical protein [Devosia elaeis]|uniref:Amino acid transporter n=1 Tax=Devosia elaeis TaxID=1770058 RepID=A0A178I4A0_9HYPH|nr:hypothetical protein [Devosia elaeis]OAM80030.1 hypothetical protein A3840_02130 [Devosia elaeis]
MSKLVRNEQRKLTANYMNGLAMAFFGIGGFAPLVASAVSGPASPLIPLLVFGCILASAGLHLLARIALKELEE